MRRPLLALALTASVFTGISAQAHASDFVLSVMQDDNNLIYSNASSRTVALNRMKSIGVDAVRVSVLWNAVAPNKKLKNGANPKSYRAANWDKYDDLVRAAKGYGIQVYFDVTPPGPRWTQAKANVKANQRAWKPNATQFGRFYQAVAKRFSGTYKDENEDHKALPRVSWWGIGNEPNQGGWLEPQSRKIGRHIVPTSPAIYRSLLVAGAKALIKTGHSKDTINMGETAPLGVAPQSETRPLRPALFLRELFCLDSHLRKYKGTAAKQRSCSTVKSLSVLKKLPKLVYAHHPYTKGTIPTKKDKSPDAITIANLNALPTLLDKIARKTKLIRSGLPVVLTEFGWETNPPDVINGISLANQAEWDNLGDYAAFANPRVVANTQFLLFDVAPQKQYKKDTRNYWFTYQSGLFFNDGRTKPSAPAYMLPFVVKKSGANYLFWGQVRFTPNGTNQMVHVQVKQGSDWVDDGAPVQVTNAAGFWQLTRPAQKGAIYRVLWIAADNSGELASREITIP